MQYSWAVVVAVAAMDTVAAANVATAAVTAGSSAAFVAATMQQHIFV